MAGRRPAGSYCENSGKSDNSSASARSDRALRATINPLLAKLFRIFGCSSDTPARQIANNVCICPRFFVSLPAKTSENKQINIRYGDQKNTERGADLVDFGQGRRKGLRRSRREIAARLPPQGQHPGLPPRHGADGNHQKDVRQGRSGRAVVPHGVERRLRVPPKGEHRLSGRRDSRRGAGCFRFR